MSKPALLLRLAAIVALLECLGHTMLFVRYVPVHGPAETAVVDAMKSHVFNFGGSPRSYWDLYFGYGLFVSIGSFVEAALLWQLAGLAASGVPRIRPLAGLVALAELGYTLLIRKYFFATPLFAHVVATVLVTAAFLMLRDKIIEEAPVTNP